MLKLLIKSLKNGRDNQFRNYVTKILSTDPAHYDDLPVHKYPAKSSKETILYGWGLAEHGALGLFLQKRKKMKTRDDPKFRTYNKPLRLLFGEQHRVKDIAAGFGFSVFSVRNENFKVFGTGLNTDSQIGYQEARHNKPLEILLAPVPISIPFRHAKKTKVTGLSAGRAHLAIMTDIEGVFTLGNNAYGQCGRAIIHQEKYLASRIVHNIPNFDGEAAISVECGQDHTLFLTESGKVYSCGWGADGQTGLGHYNNHPIPSLVEGDIKGEKIVKVSSKCDCILAINDKGDVFGWGNSEYSQIFDRSDPRQQINVPIHMKKCQGFGKIIDIASAGSFCLMLNEAGDVFTWGYGILGQGPNVSQNWTPVLIPPILFGRNDFQRDCKVDSIYCGLHFSGAINNYGDIYTWGKTKDFCLGLGENKNQYFPLKVSLGGKGRKLSLGIDHGIALCRPIGPE